MGHQSFQTITVSWYIAATNEGGEFLTRDLDKAEAFAAIKRAQGAKVSVWTPVEELTDVGIQLVIPGAERVQPTSKKQGELF